MSTLNRICSGRVMLLGLVISACLLCRNASASEGERGTLAGLPGVNVVIEGLSPDATSAGLSEDQMRTLVEMELRKLGVSILSKERSHATDSAPYLYVRVGAFRTSNGHIVYNYTVEAHQIVALRPSARGVTYGATWDAGGFGIAPHSEFKSKIKELVTERVQSFANDYLAANPPLSGVARK